MKKTQKGTSGALSVPKPRFLDQKLLDMPDAYQKKLQQCCKKSAIFAGDRGIKIVVQGDKGHSDT